MQNALLFGDRTDPTNGLGRLAQTLVDNVEGVVPISGTDHIDQSATALVHTRRTAELLPALIEHCQRTGQPLLNLGTGFEVELPERLNFLYLECPNISLKVIDFMERVQQACEQVEEPFSLHIIEHHQATKKDRSGTAQAMHDHAATLPHCKNTKSYYRKNIVSVRGLAETRKAGFALPPEHEQGYAIHEAQILSANQSQKFEPLEIYGRQTYAEGLASVLKTLERLGPLTGRMPVVDFARVQNLI